LGKGEAKVRDADFKALTDRAGFSLDDAEAEDLKARFEAAIKIIRPLRDIDLGALDLGVGDLAVTYPLGPEPEPEPEPEPNRDRS
jgi:hypothetical protein